MLAPGDVIDQRYRVAGLVGAGGMAEVFRATDTVTGRAVAVKVLRDHEPGQAERFRAEADALARLDHPGLVRLRDTGTHEGTPYLVLDLADGPSLADRLDAAPLGIEQTVAVGEQVADALAHAHRLGVVHRDVKPSNILGDGTGRWRLADFGIARLAGASSLTGTGLVVGSPPYLAPEQVEGRSAGPAADVYALGLVVIECLTGHRCYPGGHVEAALARLHRRPVIPADLPAWLRDVLAAMTARDPVRRPSTAAVADAFCDRTAEPVVAVTAEHPAVVDGTAAVPVLAPGNRTAPRPPRILRPRRPPLAGRARALAAVGTAAALVVSLAVLVTGTGGDDPATRSRPEPAPAPAPAPGPAPATTRTGPTAPVVDPPVTTETTSAPPADPEPVAAGPDPPPADPEPVAADPDPPPTDPDPPPADPEPETTNPDPPPADPEPETTNPDPPPADPEPAPAAGGGPAETGGGQGNDRGSGDGRG